MKQQVAATVALLKYTRWSLSSDTNTAKKDLTDCVACKELLLCHECSEMLVQFETWEVYLLQNVQMDWPKPPRVAKSNEEMVQMWKDYKSKLD